MEKYREMMELNGWKYNKETDSLFEAYGRSGDWIVREYDKFLIYFDTNYQSTQKTFEEALAYYELLRNK